MENGPDTPLPADVLARLLADAAPRPPQPAAAARIRERVLARIRAEPQALLRDEGWRPLLDKAEMKVLSDDGVTRSWMVRMQAGGELPPHVHEDGDEECVVLEGEVWVDGRRFGPGDYTVALRGSAHRRVYTPTGALFFLRSPSPHAHHAARRPA